MSLRPYRGPNPRYLLLVAAALGCGLTEIPVGTGAPGAAADASVSSQSDGSGAPGPGGPAVVIAGTAVPRERALVFLHLGHSNMAGRSETPSSERPFFYDTDPNLWAYARGGVWRPAKEPLSGDSMTDGRAGLGMAILRAALALAPRAQVISIGRGQSGQTSGYCRSPIEVGDHHYTLIGQKLWAQRGLDLLVKAGLAPWASP